MNWKEVSKPRSSRGIGIRHERDVNYAFMMKIGWGLVEKKYSLWVCVLGYKYNYGNDILPEVDKKNSSSNLWIRKVFAPPERKIRVTMFGRSRMEALLTSRTTDGC